MDLPSAQEAIPEVAEALELTGLERREQLLQAIRGQTVLVPDLHPIFEKHRSPVNPNYERLVPTVNEKLASLVGNGKMLEKLKTADFALFASNWWPKAEFEELKIVCFLAIWLFLWDDELDEPTGEHADNFDSAQKYREETLVFLEKTLKLSPVARRRTNSISDNIKNISEQVKITYQACLGLFNVQKDPVAVTHRIVQSFYTLAQNVGFAVVGTLGFNSIAPQLDPPRASHPIIESFRPIGEALAEAYTVEQRQTFLEELKFYISTTVTEQKFKLTGEIPTLEQYWSLRMGTSAVAACLGVIEYAHKIRGPYVTTREPTLIQLCDEANIIVVIANDMLSLKKEIRVGAIDSLIPLSCVDDANVQRAMDKAHIDLLAAVERFETAATRILTEPNATGMSQEELRIFVDGCRECWIGNFNWSLCTGRYGLGAIDQKNGSFTVAL